MKPTRFAVVLALLASVAAAPPAEAGVPPENGALVVRGPSGAGDAIIIINTEDELVAILDGEDSFFCNVPTQALDGISQMVMAPSGGVRTSIRRDMFARVYHPATFQDFFLGGCGFVNGGPLLASGIVSVRTSTRSGGPGAATSTQLINGQIETPDGAGVHLLGRIRFVGNPAGNGHQEIDLSVNGPGAHSIGAAPTPFDAGSSTVPSTWSQIKRLF